MSFQNGASTTLYPSAARAVLSRCEKGRLRCGRGGAAALRAAAIREGVPTVQLRNAAAADCADMERRRYRLYICGTLPAPNVQLRNAAAADCADMERGSCRLCACGTFLRPKRSAGAQSRRRVPKVHSRGGSERTGGSGGERTVSGGRAGGSVPEEERPASCAPKRMPRRSPCPVAACGKAAPARRPSTNHLQERAGVDVCRAGAPACRSDLANMQKRAATCKKYALW